MPTNGVEKHQAQRYPEQRVDHGEEPPVHGLGRGVAVPCSTQSAQPWHLTLTYGGEHGGGVVEGSGELPGHARLVRFVQQHHLLEQVEIILTMIPRCRYLECLCNKGVPGD